MPFWQFFRNRLISWIGHTLLVQPSKSNCSNWKILFVLGSYEYLERLEGKIRDGIFFCVNKSDNYSVRYATIKGLLLKVTWATFSQFSCKWTFSDFSECIGYYICHKTHHRRLPRKWCSDTLYLFSYTLCAI